MMELSSQEGEIPIPINSGTSYGGGHGNGHGLMIHHHHEAPAAAAQHNQMMSSSTNGMQMEQQEEGLGGGYNNKKVVRYRECLKNHAAAMGGNATDGCGEFMPSGEEGTIEALNCSACHCHRNFHRKEVEGDPPPPPPDFLHTHTHRSRKFPLALPYPTPTGNILPSRTVPPHHHHMNMIMPYNIGPLPSESDEQEEAPCGGIVQARPTQLVKKRFRTKFTPEQKDKMLNFAHKVGWKIQKQEESVVQQFCQEIGVKRRVLKVWMHNNKHSLSKHDPPSQPSIN